MIHSNSEWSTSPHEAVSGSWSINFAHNLLRSSQPTILTCVVLYVIYLEAFYAWYYNTNRHVYSFDHTIVLSTIQILSFTPIRDPHITLSRSLVVMAWTTDHTWLGKSLIPGGQHSLSCHLFVFIILKQIWHDNAYPAPNICTNSRSESSGKSIGSVANY